MTLIPIAGGAERRGERNAGDFPLSGDKNTENRPGHVSRDRQNNQDKVICPGVIWNTTGCAPGCHG